MYRNGVDRIADIARVLATARTPAVVEKLLRELLTPGEVQRLSLRWEIVRLLAAGRSQRTIARRLGVSLCNITRGARELKQDESMLRRVLTARPATRPHQRKERKTCKQK